MLVQTVDINCLFLDIDLLKESSPFWISYINFDRKLWFDTVGFLYPKPTFEFWRCSSHQQLLILWPYLVVVYRIFLITIVEVKFPYGIDGPLLYYFLLFRFLL